MVLSIGIVYWQRVCWETVFAVTCCVFMVTGYRAQRGLPSKSVPNRIRYRTIRYKIFVTTELEYIFLNIVLYLLWNTFNHREFYQVDPLNCHLSQSVT